MKITTLIKPYIGLIGILFLAIILFYYFPRLINNNKNQNIPQETSIADEFFETSINEYDLTNYIINNDSIKISTVHTSLSELTLEDIKAISF